MLFFGSNKVPVRLRHPGISMLSSLSPISILSRVVMYYTPGQFFNIATGGLVHHYSHLLAAYNFPEDEIYILFLTIW